MRAERAGGFLAGGKFRVAAADGPQGRALQDAFMGRLVDRCTVVAECVVHHAALADVACHKQGESESCTEACTVARASMPGTRSIFE